MTRRAQSVAFVAIALSFPVACSLHSLDYLNAGSDEPSAGGGGADGAGATSGKAATGGASANGDSGASSGAGAQGGTGATSGTGANGGSDPEGGAGGAPEVPDCNDDQQTVDETDLDCGGRTCEPCPAGDHCLAGTDCQSGICTNQVCQAPTCTDIAVNGDETDMNCGGKCTPCAEGQHCKVDADCNTKKCAAGMCESTVCEDGVLQDGCPLLVDNTPYALSPGHALKRCIDDNALSVAEGNGMVLYSCKVELHQTFWATAQADGYFAFRNALSAKCLQVRGASTAENAAVEQSTCDYAPEQLWKPTRVDDSLMQLTNKLSGLPLDVAGTNVDADFQGITQGKVGSTADTQWRLQKRSSAAYIALSASDDTANRLRHEAALVTLQPDDMPSAQWKIVPGLSDIQFVSFQSRDEPGRYLRHAGYRLWADTNDGSSQFKKDATFHFANPLAGGGGLRKSWEAHNFPGFFLRRTGSTISLTQQGNDAAYNASSTWIIAPR
ncbi:MAG TPA: AbfB domain-containing protein [Polyangiaceae bacterium]|nr:AbfB domain-containing protein [Polyangiaceae bacterium]